MSRERRWTFIVATVGGLLFAIMLAGVVRYASYTWAYDYLAYDGAVRRLVAGGSPYDLAFQQAGPFGLFYYPPTFLLALWPLTLVTSSAGAWVWFATITVAFLAAIALMPVRPFVRALVFLLGATCWPVLYALKIGQVTPILLLLFTVGWRWRDHPWVVGIASALGTAIKLQPAVVIAWMLLTRRWRAAAVAVGLVAAASVAITVAVGIDGWRQFSTLLSRVADPITTATNFTPGATAYHLGASVDAARAIQTLATIGVLGVLVLASLRASDESSYLVAVVVSMLVSPILWDHYALFLLLPVAWLLERRQWWAALIPLSQSAVLLDVTPPVGYLAGYAAALLGLLVLGWHERAAERAPSPALGTVSA